MDKKYGWIETTVIEVLNKFEHLVCMEIIQIEIISQKTNQLLFTYLGKNFVYECDVF